MIDNSTKYNIFFILNESVNKKKKFYTGIIFSIISALLSLFIPIIIGEFIENISDVESHLSFENIILGLLFLILIYMFQGFCSYWLGQVGAEAMKNLQKKFYKHILELELSKARMYTAGDIASRSTSDINEVSLVVTVTIPSIVKNISIVLLCTIVLWILNYKITLLIVAILLNILFISKTINSKLERMYAIHQSILGEISTNVIRYLKNIIMVKTFLGEEREYKDQVKVFEKLENNLICIVKNQVFWNVFLSSSMMWATLLVVLIARNSASNNVIGLNALSVYILYLFQLLSPALDLVNSITDLVESNGALQRVTEILYIPTENNDGMKEIDFIDGKVLFDKVKFAYSGNGKKLKDITMEIPARKVTAIVGPSGAGKTTLFSLLAKLYINYEGKIFIDNYDISDVSIKAVRENISYVAQENFIMPGTVIENLRYGKNNKFSQDEVLNKLEKMNLLDLFLDFQDGIFTKIDEDGNNLSEGQKQKISIVRAIISEPLILMLDEITSSLDTKTERDIMNILELQRGKMTMVIIAHRLNTVQNADIIYVLDNDGNIENYGTHSQLLKVSKIYKNLNLELNDI